MFFLDSVSQSSADTNRCTQKGMGCSMLGDINRGQWAKEEPLLHINVLELKSVKLAPLTFNKQKSLKAIHLETDNTTALLYLVKMWGTGNQMLLKLSKEIGQYLLKHEITITTDWKRLGPIGMEILPKSISTSLPEQGNAQSRFVCITAVSQTTQALCLETQPF